MLPEKWYLKGSAKLSAWIQKREKEEGISIAIYGGYVSNFYFLTDPLDLNSWDGSALEDSPNDYTEITFEEFEKYVLNKTPEVKEDMSYLIKILKRCNIK